MIFTEKKITINNDQCKIDSPVVLYRGDYNVEVRFTIVSSPYKYSNKQETNVTESTEASFGQLIINVPNSKPIFSDVTPVESDGAIIFTIKKEMIDESIELGEYDFQIRLFDENQKSRATIPPVIQGIKIKEPIAIENETNVAQVNYGSTSTSTSLDSFDSDGNYIETSWKDRDLITDSKLNKIEKALTGINNKAKDIEGSIPTKTSQLNNDSGYVTDTEMRTAIENKNTIYDSRMTDIETKNTEQDNRLDIAENRLNNIGNDITNTMQPIIDAHTSRLDAIEAIDVAQNNRLNAIEVKNQQQDDRLLDIEKTNKRQDMDLKCLFTEAKNNMIDITEEGNNINLQNSTEGHVFIDEIKGNTLVNCNKESDKELILNGNINTSGDNNITITEGVDGGLVDVALEGNTLVNVSKTKDSTALPLEEELAYLYANTQYTVQFIADKAITVDITLGGTKLLAQSIVIGLNRITITTPSTLVDNKLIIDGVGANIKEVVVTNTDREFGYFEGMKSVGECENNTLEIICKNNDNSKSNTQTLTHEPLRAVGDIKDKYVLIDGKWYIERNCYQITIDGTGLSNFSGFVYRTKIENILVKQKNIYTTTNFINDSIGYKTNIDFQWNHRQLLSIAVNLNIDAISTVIDIVDPRVTFDVDNYKNYLKSNPITVVFELTSPTYEPIDYNPFTVYSDVTHISNNSTIPANMVIKNTGYNCLLKPKTTYTVSSNLGLNVVTTPSTLTEDCLRFYDTDTSSVTTMKDVTILEGDYTTGKPMPSHFAGIESAFEQELVTDENDEHYGKYKVTAKVVGKNKIYPKDAELDYCGLHYSGNGLTTSITGTITATSPDPYLWSDKTAEKTYPHHVNSKQIVTSWSTDTNVVLQVVYKKVSTGNLYYSDGFGQGSVVIPEGYVIYGVRHLPRTIGQVIDGTIILQLEEGNTATDYEPYKENNMTFYINEPLRGIGDIKDKVYIKDDKVVVERNCGIRAYKDGDFGTYLTDKVNTVYPLAEPTYEEIEYNDTKLFIESFKNSTLFYNSNVPVTSKLYYSYSVPIVDKVAQTANISDQQDSMIIDMATQCAIMEMMLM